MRATLLAGALALLWCNNVESLTTQASTSPTIPGFVNGAIASLSRKRPRGSGTAGAGASRGAVEGVPGRAMAGSFTTATLPGGESAWLGGIGKGRPRGTQRGAGGGQGLRMMFGLGFHPPEFGAFVHGTVQAIMLGGFAALIPKVTAERIREKEDGLDMDEAYEAGLLNEDDYDDDEFGYAGGYVCETCDNTNEVECPQCRGKGFFVSSSAMPKKCNYCSGLGTFGCEECEERRERLRRERGDRRSPRELPPARGDDFPLTW